MCGFIGKIRSRSNLAGGDEVPLVAALPFLRNRGPDSANVWHSEDGCVDLLFARLAIVDPDSRANQPFVDKQRHLAVVFNGEIYNYKELRSDLSDYPFRSDSDTEVLLAAYARFGISGLTRLRGTFSCAIVDCDRRRVYLARDPIGKKPLYVALWPDGIYFGSSVLAMLAATRVDVSVEQDLLDTFWRLGCTPHNRSMLADCNPVLPGDVLEFNLTNGTTAVHSCAPTIEQVTVSDIKEVSQHIVHLLRQSVRRRLDNNPHPVSLLSGGVDSTVVTKHVHDTCSATAITLGGHRWTVPDASYARYAATKLGIPLTIVHPQVRRLEDDVRWAFDLQDEPLGMISFFMLAILMRAVRQHTQIVFTGDGGDEVFLGYGSPADWVDETGAPHAGKASDATRVGPSPPIWMSSWGRWQIGPSLVSHMFTKLDRASAEQGIEARCPLLDLDLLLFARSLSPDQLFCTGTSKGLLKRQLCGWPERFVERPKVGFTYRMRWLWGMRRYHGLREMVSTEAISAFRHRVPEVLRRTPMSWSTYDIFRNFTAAWKLMAWSRFTDRIADARRSASPETKCIAPIVN